MVAVLTKGGEIFNEGDDRRERTIQFLIDVSGSLVSVQGKHEEWLGQTKQQLVGQNLTSLVHETSKILVSDILSHTALREKMASFVLYIEGVNHQVLGCEVGGRPFPRDPQYFHLELVVDPALGLPDKVRNSQAGLVDNVQRALAQNEDKDLGLTFVDVGNVDQLQKDYGVSEDRIEEFKKRITERLQRDAVGDTVSQVDSGKYGLVHEAGADLSGVENDLRTYASDIDPLDEVLAVAASTVQLEKGALSEDQVESAIAHAVDRFVDDGIDAVIFETLEDSQAAWVDRRKGRLALLKEVLDSNQLSVGFCVTANAAEWQVDHFNSEFRADLETDGLGAEEIVSLVKDDHALRTRVDIAQCTSVINDTRLNAVGVSISLAIRSLLEQRLLAGLVNYAKGALNRRLILRIEGLTPEVLPRITALQTVRDAGFEVALFGKEIGAISEERLQSLPADYIIMDPALVLDVVALQRSLPALRGMAERCGENGIGVIFDGVVEVQTVNVLAGIPGALAAGPYFGEAVSTPSQISMPVRASD